MKTILTAWVIALFLYVLTPYAIAEDQSVVNAQTIWTGYNVVGELCINVRNKTDGKPAHTILHLISDGRWSEAINAEGFSCLDVAFSPKNELRRTSSQNDVVVDIVDDSTTPFITIELPI